MTSGDPSNSCAEDLPVASVREISEGLEMGAVNFCRNCGLYSEESSNADAPNICPTCKLPLEKRRLLTLREMRAHDVGVPAIFRLHVVGESQQKALDAKFHATCDCGESLEIDLLATDLRPTLIQMLTQSIRRQPLNDLPNRNGQHKHNWAVEATESVDYRKVRVRDVVGLEESAEQSHVARDYTAFFLNTMTAEKKLLCDGQVFIHPKSDDLTVLVEHTWPLGASTENFILEEQDLVEFRNLENLDYEGLLSLADSAIAPNIKGRGLAKLASLLAVCSVNWFLTQNSELPVPGCLRVLLVGDKRCGKGTIIRWWHQKLGLGEYGIGEAASRAGLLYFVDVESLVIVWGLLPRADHGLALIEALHGVPSEQLLEFREVLVQQKVTVEKKVSGDAWCRTRIIADANPQKDLKEFVFPAQALTSLRCFIDPVDLTRWDLFIPFDQDEVPIEEIVNLNPIGEEGLPVGLTQKLAMFAWSRRIDQVRITDEALEHAKGALTQRLSKFRLGEIPLIHNASLWTLLRISVAFAIATFSVLQNEIVVVLRRHVEMAERLIIELLERWAVEDYIEFAGAKPVTDQEFRELADWVNGSDIVKGLLRELASRRWQAKDLAAKIEHEYSSVRHSLSDLKAKELVVRKSDGYDLTRKGAAVAKQVLFNKAENQSKEGFAERRESAFRVLRELCNETGGNPTKDEYLARLREEKIPDPEGLLRSLLNSGDVYEPEPGRLRCTRL